MKQIPQTNYGVARKPIMTTVKKTGYWLFLFGLSLILFARPIMANNVPHEIAGITLGTNIDNYPDIIHSNSLEEVVVTDWHGFRKGIISYGTCKYIDQILKIDMKYENRSKQFFNELLDRFRKEFGDTGIWSGDSFGVMLSWKWNFVDKDQNRVNVTLQYNGKNSSETIGNVVKLSYPDKIEEERRCFAELCQNKKEKTNEQRQIELNQSDWSHLIPR